MQGTMREEGDPGPARYHAPRVGGCLSATVERRPDGTVVLRSTEPLAPPPARLTDCLAHWATAAPDRTFVARRAPGGGDWVRTSFSQMLARARAVGQWAVDQGLSAERPLAILSGNSIEHLTLYMGAMWAGVPVVPVSPAYSLISTDFAKLRHVVDTCTPGAVYADDAAYARAIAAAVPPGVPAVLRDGRLADRPSTPLADVLATVPGPSLAGAHALVGPDTIVKFLFTSGSTRLPKAVPNTQRMMCVNMQMIRQAMPFLAEEPVLVDWLPWNHTFGGNQNIGICLVNGGTLYIDDGRPTAHDIGETLRNLREIAPTVYFNVPKGFEELSLAMDHDEPLRRRLFSRVQAFFFAGAGLSQAVWDRLDAHGERTVGHRVPIFTGLGMTETAPSCTFAIRPGIRSGHIGLPCPAVEVKLVPMGEKTEVRFRGPNVMPGYWRAPEATAQAFDEEGFYRTGDAVKFVDPADPQRGLLFDGRIGEDFKLATGTFVSVGPLRARVVVAGDPVVQDAVVAGIDRDDIGLLVLPRPADLRRHFGLSPDLPLAQAVTRPEVRAFFQAMADTLWAQGTGSANRPARLMVLVDPPSLDRGEITDKGSINQRAMLQHRADLVERLYAPGDPDVIVPRGAADA